MSWCAAGSARIALFWVLAVTMLAACSSGSPRPTGSPPPAAVASALAPGPCHDDQPGRYVDAIFTPAATRTEEYAPGLLADVYQPADDPATCRVGVVWIHGGGFTQFDRTGDAEKAWGAALAIRGYVGVLIDYRLGSGAPFSLDAATDPSRSAVVDDAIEDAQSAVAWLRGSARKLGVDPRRIAIGGTSAGAMTAAGAALTASGDSTTCTLVSISGAIEDAWVGDHPEPALFVHGDADDVVPYDSSVSAVDAFTAAGGVATLHTMAGAGHELTGPPTAETVLTVSDWLRRHAAAHCG